MLIAKQQDVEKGFDDFPRTDQKLTKVDPAKTRECELLRVAVGSCRKGKISKGNLRHLALVETEELKRGPVAEDSVNRAAYTPTIVDKVAS